MYFAAAGAAAIRRGRALPLPGPHPEYFWQEEDVKGLVALQKGMSCHGYGRYCGS
jgi:hypothetical protein